MFCKFSQIESTAITYVICTVTTIHVQYDEVKWFNFFVFFLNSIPWIIKHIVIFLTISWYPKRKYLKKNQNSVVDFWWTRPWSIFVTIFMIFMFREKRPKSKRRRKIVIEQSNAFQWNLLRRCGIDNWVIFWNP